MAFHFLAMLDMVLFQILYLRAGFTPVEGRYLGEFNPGAPETKLF